MTRRLIVARRAEIQIAKAQRWWREHRDAKDAIEEELSEAFALLRDRPFVGRPVRTRRGKDMRRLTLERIRYYLYYRVHEETIEVAVFWHTSRRPPRL
jgi:plasmid stabilization system protein ParE